MTNQDIIIKQGDADTLTETITGLTSLSGYTAKMYIYTLAGVSSFTLTGVVSSLTVTYQLVNETTKALLGEYKYETKLYDAADHVYTPTGGKFLVEPSIKADPS